MATKKKNNLGKIALLGGGAFLASKLLGADKSTVQNAGFAALPASGSGITADELLALINANPALKIALKGAKGEAGESGGEKGEKGADGLNAPIFYNSLLPNSVFNSGLQYWETGKNIALEANYLGLPVGYFPGAINGSVFHDSLFYINPERLIKIEGYFKHTSTCQVIINGHGIDDLQRNKSTNTPGASVVIPQFADFTKQTYFIGGYGNGTTNLADGTVKGKFRFVVIGGTGLRVSRLSVKQVDLGEPVPHNLPWLPVGQMVYDSSDGAVGRYNGSTVDWFTMV